MNLAARLATLACIVTFVACGGTPSTPDGGTSGVDGGASHDAGPPPHDAGTAHDAGSEDDAGSAHDAGTAVDGGEPRDSGAAPDDAGIAPETCASLEARYDAVVESKSSCEQATDCRITSGHCGAGIGGCWYALSGDVSELDALAERYRDLGCTSVVCRCAAPPESATCEDGRCVPE